MNKQELIDELTAYVKRYENMSDEDYYRGVYGAYKVALGLAERLDEPQKVKLPKAAEPWLKHAQYSTDVIDLFSAVEYATNSDGFISENWQWSGKFYDWLSEDADTLYLLCDALRYGYEIEKEPRWIVKTSEEVWVKDITTNLYSSKVIDFCDDKRPALVFLDKKIAEAVALLVDGSVEEV